MFIDLRALRECSDQGAIAVQLCTKTVSTTDYSLGITGESSYSCQAVDGYAYVDRYSLLALAQGVPGAREAWYVCLFPPFPTLEPSSRFLIENRYYQIETVFPSVNQGEDVLMRYHCLRA